MSDDVNALEGLPGNYWIAEQLAAPEKDWLLHEAIAPGGLTIVSGRPKAGKSFVAYLMAMSLASGRAIGPFKPAGRIPCLYIDREGVPKHTAVRLHLLAKGLNMPEDNLTHLRIADKHRPATFELLGPGNVQLVIEAVKASGARAVFLDTFISMFKGEENSSRAVQSFLDAMSLIRVATGAACVLVHHTNKSQFQYKDASIPMDPDGGLRGSSALAGAYDVVFSLQDGYVNGQHMDVMMSQGKYTAEWYCQYKIKSDVSEATKETTALYVNFYKRVDGLDFFSRAPDGKQPGFGPSERKLNAKGKSL